MADGLQMSLFFRHGQATRPGAAPCPGEGGREGVLVPGPSCRLIGISHCAAGGCKAWKPACWGRNIMFHTGRKGRSISLQWHFTPTAAPTTLIKSLAWSTLPGPLRGRLCPFLRWGSGVVPLHKTPASSRDAGLTPSEVSAPPGGLPAVPAAGMLRESADVGKEAMGGWGICNHSRPVAVAVCSGQVLPSGHCGAGRSAGPPHCLAGNHQVEQEGSKSKGNPCHLPITQKVLDSLKGAAELWPESMKKDSCLLLSEAQGSGREITGHSHPN